MSDSHKLEVRQSKVASVTTVLNSIIEGVRIDLDVRKQSTSLAELQERLSHRASALPAASILQGRQFSVIAEVKRASPSKGHLADIPEPAQLAGSYELGGAQVISVLTEQRRFSGTLADLDAVRANVTIPVLRKDFMVDEYQMFEARAHGADVVLLIVAGLDDALMRDLNDVALGLGMSVLVEVHDEEELERGLALNPVLLGVNARNLKTLDVDLATCERLLPLIPEGVVGVAESGIATLGDVQRMANAGARAILVGEALVTNGEPSETVRQWTNAGLSIRELTLKDG